MAVALLVLAVPRFVASLALLPGEGALAVVENGATPSQPGLMRAVESQIASLDNLAHPIPHLNIAVLAFRLAASPDGTQAQRSEMLAVARHHLRRSLAMAPGQARAWLMLAGLYRSDDDQMAAARALTLSVTADPHFPILAPIRWPLMFDLAGRLDRETRQRSHLEFLAYFRRHGDDAFRLALRLDHLAELRALVAGGPDDAARLQQVERSVEYGEPGA